MAIKFNPLTGNFDFTGSGGGGGSSYIDGEVQNFSALPQTIGSPAVDSAYLVREAEGTWLLARKPAGIYIRTANTGVRADDWTHAGAFPDVFNDANFLLYDSGDSSKNLAFQLSGITTGTTRTLTVPDASGTLALSPAETLYNITATSIGSPQQIDLSASPFTEATEVRSVLNNSTGIVYVQILLPIDSPTIVPKFRFYGQISGAGDILNIQLIRDSVVVFPASGSGYEELENGETLEVVWNGTSYGLTPNAPFMRRITLPNASGTIALTSDIPKNLWIPASAWIPKSTAGCGVDSRETTTNDQNFDELLFDAGTDEFADALVVMPSNYNNSTVTARFYWTASAAGDGTDDVVWGISGLAYANDDALDTATGTPQTVTDTLLATNDMHVSAATSAVTIGGTPAANKPIQFTVSRDADAAGDTYGGDARLLGVEIIFN
jgi:hypothetical protein